MSNAFRILENGDVFLESTDCRLKCNFCFHGIYKRTRKSGFLRQAFDRVSTIVASLVPRSGKITEEFERKISHLKAYRDNSIQLSGLDILECNEIFELLDICRRYDKKIEIISPGLKLSDRNFARRISEYDPRITVTYLTHREDTYTEMSGNPLAKQLVEKAISNMVELDIDFSVNFVATAVNYNDLLEVASFLLDAIGMDMFILLFFSPDRCFNELDPKRWDLFVEYRLLNAELAKFARRYGGTNKLLCLWRVPPCKLDDDILTCGNIFFSVNDYCDPEYPVYRHPSCDLCEWNAKCFFVSQYYNARYPDEDFEHEKVNRVFGNIRH